MKKFIFLALMIDAWAAPVQTASSETNTLYGGAANSNQVIAVIALLWCMSFAQHAQAIDCSNAATWVETTVCGDKELKDRDEELRWALGRFLDKPEEQSEITSAQDYWGRQVRDVCTDKACLMTSYSDRLQALFSDHELYLFYRDVQVIRKAGLMKMRGARIGDFYISKYARSSYCQNHVNSNFHPTFSDFKARTVKTRGNGGTGLCERLASYVRKNMMCVLDVQSVISWMTEKSGSYLDAPALSIVPKLPGSTIDAWLATKDGMTSLTYLVDIDNDRSVDVVRKNRFFLRGEEKDELCLSWGGGEDYECFRDEGGGYLEAPRLMRPLSLDGKNYLFTYSTVDQEVYAGNGQFINTPVKKFFELLSVRRGQGGRLHKEAVCHLDLVEGDKK